MIDIIGILTRTWLATANPQPIHQVTTIPLAAAPGAGSAATAAKAAPAPAPAAATAITAAQAVADVQKFYAGIKQVTAKFRQSVTNNTFGSTKTSDGTVWLAKPGKMRWDYVETKKVGAAKKVQVKKSFISNGSYLYVVEHDNKQVVKKNLQNDLMPVAVTFLYGKGNLSAEFNPEIDKSNKYGAKGDIVLKLTPKQPSAQYKNLILVVAPDNYRVKQSVIIDSSNNVNQFQFFEPDFEKAVEAKSFEFDERSVKNYRVVDADAQQNTGSGAGSAAPTTPAPIAPAPAKK
jgi:outer membrane lipoprotein carrier protein